MTVAMIPNNSTTEGRAGQQTTGSGGGLADSQQSTAAGPGQQSQSSQMCGVGEKESSTSTADVAPDNVNSTTSTYSSNPNITTTTTYTTSPILSSGNHSSTSSSSSSAFPSNSTMTSSTSSCVGDISEPDFPVAALGRLDEMIHRQRWVVPVLPDSELEVLLEASIDLAKKGIDTRSEACQRFFREGLTLSFTKILTDEAVNSWKYEIQKCILSNCEKLVELIVLKLPHDWFPLLDLLAILCNPSCKFHTFNSNRNPESIPPHQKQSPAHQVSLPSQEHDNADTSPTSGGLSQQPCTTEDKDRGFTDQRCPSTSGTSPERAGTTSAAVPAPADPAATASPLLQVPHHKRVYAKPPDYRHPRGWLVDLINYFGKLGGFDKLLERFQGGRNLSVPVMCSLLRPFGLSYEFLTVSTIETFFMPIIDLVLNFLENLTDEELKKEAKIEAKNDALTTIIKAIQVLATRVPSRQETAKNLEMFRLKMILRSLQISSFNGKMNALNEVNKVISNVNYPSLRHPPLPASGGQHEEEDWLTAPRFAEWIKENRVLQIVLRDSLHQPQYVEKLEKIIRFIIKEKALSLDDLDDIWLAQHGKHEAIVKNVHDLLAKLAWDFSPEQLDHLFERFQSSWRDASKKQREKLLELIRRLAEDDKDGDMAHKVLTLLWSLARSADVPTEILDQALSAHVKILDYSCSQDRDNQKRMWLDQCVQELKNDKWVLPALKQIREICCSYSEAPANYSQHRPVSHVSYRHDVISKLQNQHSLVVLVTENLTAYMKQIRTVAQEKPGINPVNIVPDGRYNHIVQVQDRLSFLRFLLKDGQLWLCAPQAKQIWHCLAENAVFTVDREACFKWFSKLMGDEPDLDPDINKEFFENNILMLDPKLLTEHGMRCFDRFFKAVNFKENKLMLKRRTYLTDDVDLIGTDYLWKVLLCGTEDMANRAIELLKETFTNLGPRLLPLQGAIHEEFVSNAMTRLKAMASTVSCLSHTDACDTMKQETTRMCRVLKVLYEYVLECDGEFGDERTILPLARSWRGKHMSVTVRFQLQIRQPEEVELWTHTNDTVGSLRRQLMQRLKAAPPNMRVEMYLNSELLDPACDSRVISSVPLKDKMVLTGKLAQVGNNLPSSPDSSSDSSPGSPHHPYDGPSTEAENSLPGVILSRNRADSIFLVELADLGCSLRLPALRDAARTLLSVMPAAQHTVTELTNICTEHSQSSTVGVSSRLEKLLFFSSPSTVLYNLQVMYSMLMPAASLLSEKAIEFQYNFMRSGGVKLVICMLTKNNFMSEADVSTKRSALLLVVKIAKLVFVTEGYTFASILSPHSPGAGGAVNGGVPCEGPLGNTAAAAVGEGVLLSVLQQALPHIPNSVGDCMIRSVAVALSKSLVHNINTSPTAYAQLLLGGVPDHTLVNALLTIIWSCSAGAPHLVTSSDHSPEHQPASALNSAGASSSGAAPGVPGEVVQAQPDAEDLQLCCEALETLAVVLMLCPAVLEKLSKEAQFQQLVISLVLGPCDRTIRHCAVEQLLLIATKCSASSTTLVLFIAMLFNVLTAADLQHQSGIKTPTIAYTKEYFQLLCGLLHCACATGVGVSDVEALLESQVLWLKNVARNTRAAAAAATAAATAAAAAAAAAVTVTVGGSSSDPASTLAAGSSSSNGETGQCATTSAATVAALAAPDPTLLEGHLNVTRELLAFLSPHTKYAVGGDPNTGIFLIKEIIEDFIFPFSKVYLQLEHSTVIPAEQVNPVCSTQSTVIAAYDLLVTLCTGCAPNLAIVADMLTKMFYSENEESIREWEYLPAVGPRPMKGFVGLKNAGATCYMNSVLQQLYMIRQVREGVLSVEGAATDPEEDFSGEERTEAESSNEGADDEFPGDGSGSEQSRKEYNISILKQVQAIFAHLACSKLQYYVPRGLWKDFKLQGERVNLREQHDACEFYNMVVESINEALKALGYPQLLNTYLGGSFSDQKICKSCPHRYSREEAFTVISIDIRNYSNLQDSLEQYVKGDLLEGDNAYLCEKCDKKVDTVKRICLKKLPPILAIQLKRFDYDWERETSIKFNDYFEFPRELDMDPYTVRGLARNGELIAYDESDLEGVSEWCSRYRLTGIVVHSGQASGGHYYSYICHRTGRESKWYKFDDGEVAECRMEDDEEMKNQCFGGDYMSEQIFDNMMKRVSYRRQKRWWNAYLLFYTREDVEKEQMISSFAELSISADRPGLLKMPVAMERSVVRQNVRFMHSRSQFSLDYFHFLKKLLLANHNFITRASSDKASEVEQIGLVSTQLGSKFLFMVGLRTKKPLRGPATEWYDALQAHVRSSARSRIWFVKHVLFGNCFPLSEYLLECPSPEVRIVFSKLVVAVAHSTRSDPPLAALAFPAAVAPTAMWSSLSDQVLSAVLLLVHREQAEHCRHLSQYFGLFSMYASLGIAEKRQLLKLNVAETLMSLAVDEVAGPGLKSSCTDLTKLYLVVSLLVRCCDLSSKCQSSQANEAPLPNPHRDMPNQQPLMAIQPRVADLLFGKPTYIKKVIEEAHSSEDTVKLLKYCCWENPNFSSIVLAELLAQVAYAYTYEMRPFIDLLLHMLTLEDSWQEHRLHNAFKGIPEEREGLLEIVQRTKSHYQKRAYQCVKCLVTLFSSCPAASRMLTSTPEIKRRFNECVEWLNEELNRRNFSVANQQYYNSWSPPAPSNETSNGYYLERSASAKITLEKALELCPDECEQEADEEAGDEGSSNNSQASAAPPAGQDNRVEVPTQHQQPQPSQQQQAPAQDPDANPPAAPALSEPY